MDNIKTVITIHRGEILQIKRMITKFGLTRGCLHGLLTESKQPVVLIAFGGTEKQTMKCEEALQTGHGLKKLGEWFVQDKHNDKDFSGIEISLLFNDRGELCKSLDYCMEANHDIIEDQSAFRLFKPVTNMLKKATTLDNSPIDHTPWYSTDIGKTILTEIHQALPELGFLIGRITRDPVTYEITINLEIQNGTINQIDIVFPNDFPEDKPRIFKCGGGDFLGQLQFDIDQSTSAAHIVDSLCSSLCELISQNADITEPNEDRGIIRGQPNESSIGLQGYMGENQPGEIQNNHDGSSLPHAARTDASNTLDSGHSKPQEKENTDKRNLPEEIQNNQLQAGSSLPHAARTDESTTLDSGHSKPQEKENTDKRNLPEEMQNNQLQAGSSLPHAARTDESNTLDSGDSKLQEKGNANERKLPGEIQSNQAGSSLPHAASTGDSNAQDKGDSKLQENGNTDDSKLTEIAVDEKEHTGEHTSDENCSALPGIPANVREEQDTQQHDDSDSNMEVDEKMNETSLLDESQDEPMDTAL